jgi:hypothetical protein
VFESIFRLTLRADLEQSETEQDLSLAASPVGAVGDAISMGSC